MENIFLKNLPTLDLHGFDTETARVATNDFINDNIILKNNKIVIIHGKGKGLVKKSVHETLSHNKAVKNYYTDNFNDGCTVIYLNIDNAHFLAKNDVDS